MLVFRGFKVVSADASRDRLSVRLLLHDFKTCQRHWTEVPMTVYQREKKKVPGSGQEAPL